jgi:hypothetical protein
MFKYLVVITVAYMIFAGLFSVKYAGGEMSVSFNVETVKTRVVSDLSSLVEISK